MFEILNLVLLLFLGMIIPINLKLQENEFVKIYNTTAGGADFTKKGYNQYIAPLTIYCLCLLKCASKIIGNPFQEKKKGFLTVSTLSCQFTQQLEEIRYVVTKQKQNPFTVLSRDSVIEPAQKMERGLRLRSSIGSHEFQW